MARPTEQLLNQIAKDASRRSIRHDMRMVKGGKDSDPPPPVIWDDEDDMMSCLPESIYGTGYDPKREAS